MSVKITFEFEDFREATAFLMEHTTAPVRVDDTPSVEPAPVDALPIKEPVKKKTTKKKTTKKEATAKKSVAKEPNKEVAYSVDDCRIAIGKVNEKADLKAAWVIMKAYNVKNVTELKPERYADFIQACESYESYLDE